MKNEAKNCKVSIFGDVYSLVSDENQEHLMQVASQVDAMMKEIASKLPNAEVKKIAVLAALRLACQSNKNHHIHTSQEEQAQSLIKLIDSYLLSWCR
jgi:cell division protein ZapA (FtsZ GTPase activity inhibitor)